MESKEIEKQKKMTYKELTDYLLEKYGNVPYNYFCNESCKSKNHKNSRSKEGLIIHHIDEDKAIMLATPRVALMNPYEYQNADRLVYCNYIEHLILHIKIAEEPKHKYANEREIPGIGGAVNFIIPELNDYYMGFKYQQEWRINAFDLVKENYKDYIELLRYLWKIVQSNEKYSKMFNLDKLSRGYGTTLYKKIKKEIK